MSDTATAESVATPETVAPSEDEMVTADLLVEEVSIDGMCGVY